MARVTRCTSALGAVLFALVGLSACGGVPGNAVVQVGGTPITKDTFAHWMEVAAASTAATPGSKPVIPDPPTYTNCIAHLKATQPPPAKGQSGPTEASLKAQCEQQYKSMQTEVLSFLISSSWVLKEAEAMGVHVSDKEVHKKFEELKNQEFPKSAEFQKFLSASGQTVSDLLLRVKLNLVSSKLQQKITKSKSNPTQAQIEKYYKEHSSQFGTPERRNVDVILTKSEEQAKKAKKEIESGKSFATLAKTVSIDPVSKASGGMLTGVIKGEEQPALDSAIFSAKANALGGPVKTPFGYYIYEVKSITPGTEQTLAEAKPTVKAQLAATNQQAALSKFVESFKKRWTEKTECSAGYEVMDCKGYKAPKGASGSTGAT
ncbi:MAG TPA: peptidyl-prolyl cis-trans isomerase [Solirubrobacteraceae bacterium]|nr:peptidyl-prolyl cis-trans isomerase [Solirubrobacteraceae bacterium]